MQGIEVPTQLLIVYFLLHLRLCGLLFSSSIFTESISLVTVRYFLAVLLTIASIGSISPDNVIPVLLFEDVFTLGLLAMREILIGVALGFLSDLPLAALRVAGEQIGTVIGFSMAQTYDPTTQSQNSLIGQLNFLIGLWFYFHWNGHLLLIRAAIETLKLVPLGQLLPFPPGDMGLARWMQELFFLSLRVVLPFYCALLLADVGLGFLARTVPQMNVFVLGLPVKVALGFMVLAAVLPLSVDFIFTRLEPWIEFAMSEVRIWRALPLSLP